jgi:hypothetical protein
MVKRQQGKSDGLDDYATSFWENQLTGVDFSLLPDAPTEVPKPVEPEPETDVILPLSRDEINHRALVALLDNLRKNVNENPDLVAQGMFLCHLSNGNYRVVFPFTYTKEDLQQLVLAALQLRALLEDK